MAIEAPQERQAGEAKVAKRMKQRRPDFQAAAYVRVFAHQVRPGRQPNDRLDFTETLYWSAGTRTDAIIGRTR